MTITPYYEADDFSFDVTVKEGGVAKDLDGASVVAVVGCSGDNEAVTANVHDAPNGIVRISWDEDTLVAGVYELHVRVTIGTETQTVFADFLTVNPSLRAA